MEKLQGSPRDKQKCVRCGCNTGNACEKCGKIVCGRCLSKPKKVDTTSLQGVFSGLVNNVFQPAGLCSDCRVAEKKEKRVVFPLP